MPMVPAVSAYRCTRCGDTALVFPLHGVEKGGPLVCPKCAHWIENGYWPERHKHLYALGRVKHRRPADPTELSLELLQDALALTHPDKHPPERADLAHRVTAELNALKPYIRPAPKPEPPPPPKPPVTDKNTSLRGTTTKELLDAICLDCIGYPPMYFCSSCRADWQEGQRRQRECENAKRRERYARRRAWQRMRQPAVTCQSCGEECRPNRRDAKYCSPACRQRALRQRRAAA